MHTITSKVFKDSPLIKAVNSDVKFNGAMKYCLDFEALNKAYSAQLPAGRVIDKVYYPFGGVDVSPFKIFPDCKQLTIVSTSLHGIDDQGCCPSYNSERLDDRDLSWDGEHEVFRNFYDLALGFTN